MVHSFNQQDCQLWNYDLNKNISFFRSLRVFHCTVQFLNLIVQSEQVFSTGTRIFTFISSLALLSRPSRDLSNNDCEARAFYRKRCAFSRNHRKRNGYCAFYSLTAAVTRLLPLENHTKQLSITIGIRIYAPQSLQSWVSLLSSAMAIVLASSNSRDEPERTLLHLQTAARLGIRG